MDSSEPSVIDIAEKEDDLSINVCPGHLIVNTKDCMNINALEY